MKTSAGFLTLILLAGNLFADDAIRGVDRFEFKYSATIPKLEGPAELWIPLAGSDAFQTVRIERVSFPVEWRKIQDRAYQNEIAILKLGPAESGKAIEVDYNVTRREQAAYPVSGDPAPFLKPDRLVPRNATFLSLAQEATRGKSGDLARGRALYDHVLARMKYDKTGTGWGRGDAVYACDARTGNCTDFHSYFIALARAINIPARFAIGFTIPSDENEGKIAGYHCWAEFLADGKWIPVDISEAWKTPALADYYFGHHPANRFEFTRGRDLMTDPEPQSGPINFLVYPLLEAGGQPLKMETNFSFRRLATGQPETAQAH